MTETPLATPLSPALRLTRRAALILGGGGVLLLAILLAVSIGAVAVPLSTTWGVLANHLIPGLVTPDWTQGHEAIVWDIRFPRALLAALVGAGLVTRWSQDRVTQRASYFAPTAAAPKTRGALAGADRQGHLDLAGKAAGRRTPGNTPRACLSGLTAARTILERNA